MKKILVIMIVIMMSVSSFAQKKEVTKFLNIPVDGTFATMKSNLEAKGFDYKSNNTFVGKFNGYPAFLTVNTNKEVVQSIMVTYRFTNEILTKCRYNDLIISFWYNKKYYHLGEGMAPRIQNSEHLRYELTLGDKNYTKLFYQLSENENENGFDKLNNRIVALSVFYSDGYYDVIILYSNEYNKSNEDDL